jgi:hypothetical protein
MQKVEGWNPLGRSPRRPAFAGLFDTYCPLVRLRRRVPNVYPGGQPTARRVVRRLVPGGLWAVDPLILCGCRTSAASLAVDPGAGFVWPSHCRSADCSPAPFGSITSRPESRSLPEERADRLHKLAWGLEHCHVARVELRVFRARDPLGEGARFGRRHNPVVRAPQYECSRPDRG